MTLAVFNTVWTDFILIIFNNIIRYNEMTHASEYFINLELDTERASRDFNR